MEENNKPDVFNQNTPQQPQISEAEKQMIANRERELAERQQAKPTANPTQPVLPGMASPHPIVEPDYGSDYDMLPLPSEGKTYPNKKPTIKVSFLNAADENILTNPNLLKSGRFLEVLFTRKILESSISYRDLLIGDRDAIMIWLRSTGYGTTYPIEVMDPKTFEEFNTEIELDELKTKKLKIEPDAEGYFDFELPSSKKKIKFRFLTVGDADDIEKRGEELKKDPNSTFDLATFTLQKQIVEVEGNRDPLFIKDFVSKMRMADSRAFKKYVSENECGVDLNLTVETPGGGQVKTFFPLNPSFFGLNFKYKEFLLKEIYICINHLHMQRSEVLAMPTYERRFYLGLLKQVTEKEDAEMNVAYQEGRKVESFSGEALKQKLRNNEIPN